MKRGVDAKHSVEVNVRNLLRLSVVLGLLAPAGAIAQTDDDSSTGVQVGGSVSADTAAGETEGSADAEGEAGADATSPFDEPEPDPVYAPPPPPPPSPVAVTPPPPPPAVEEEEEEPTVWDSLSANVFADAFYMADWNRPSDPTAASSVPHRAFDSSHGFQLAFAGLDVAYEGEQVGATINLRFGDGARRLIGNDEPVFSVLKQGYLTWSPTEQLSFDLGQFDTIYGAEVADSWQNLNYTRGALYYLMQPFYHTGLRAGYQVNDTVSLTGLIVNGTNNPIDNNQSPHVGLQVGLTPSDDLGFWLGYYGGAGSSGFGGNPERSDDEWEHFFDAVLNVTAGDLTFVGNADFYLSGPDTGEGPSFYWGASAALGYALTEMFGVAGRVEFLHDPTERAPGTPFISGAYDWLATGTVTLDFKPIENLIIRLDNRIEFAEADVFADKDGVTDIWFATTLGAVVKAN